MNTPQSFLAASRPSAGRAACSAQWRRKVSRIGGQRHCRRRAPLAEAAGGSDGGSGCDSRPPAAASPAASTGRREVLLRSLHWLLLAEMAGGSEDGRTILNSVLGAYGLPQLKPSKGFRVYDDPEEPFTFVYPTSWVRRKNTGRAGLAVSDYGTADKLSLEIFPEPSSSSSAADLAAAAVQKLIVPASEIGGDARLELPPASRIKSEQREIDGKVYTYIAFPSETTTRSGYQVRRKNLAVAAARKGNLYVLGCSARSDQFDKEKEATFETIVQSFRLL